MLQKFFPRDKNYILKEAQLSLEESLLLYLVDYVKIEFLLHHNPLGLQDDIASRIQDHKPGDLRHLHEFYLNLMAVFRYTHYSDNQLEFIFDGKDDFEKYREEWTVKFKAWVKEFCKHHNFLRAVLDLTVFYPADSPVIMVDNRMNAFISRYFEVKIHPLKGIQKKSVA
ncbi:MAG: hypothetical protein ACOYXT_22725 [Bacteroidota bacterium]